MRLYLVRHGEATSESENPERPLTEQGRSDAKKVANFIKMAGVQVSHIWHSSKRRAKETAEIMGEALRPDGGIAQVDNLKPNDPPEAIMDKIGDVSDDLMIVGHLPHLGNLVSLVLFNEGSQNFIQFQQVGCIALERDGDGNWSLIWAVMPSIISGEAEHE